MQILLQLASRTQSLLPNIETDQSNDESQSQELGLVDWPALDRSSNTRRRKRPTPSTTPHIFTPKRVSPIHVQLANRTGPFNSEHKALKFPRRSRRGPQASPTGFGSAELACLLRIVAIVTANLSSPSPVLQTKRDLFYTDVRLFKSQKTVDVLVDDLAATLACRRIDLCVVASTKGVMFGACQICTTSAHILDAAQATQLIPPRESIEHLQIETCRIVLVVEKDAVFQTLKEQFHTMPQGTLLVCGKGQPDVTTRELVRLLAETLPDTQAIFHLSGN